jgi:hypothetical protein
MSSKILIRRLLLMGVIIFGLRKGTLFSTIIVIEIDPAVKCIFAA